MNLTKLSNYERARYNYLMSHYHYLTGEELEELDYLTEKTADKDESDGVFSKDSAEQLQHPEPVAQAVGHSKQMKSRKKLGYMMKSILLFLIVLFSSIIFMFVRGQLSIGGDGSDYQPASTQVFNGQATSDGINILIMGSDKRPIDGDEGVRTDSIMVLNIGNSSGQPKLVSFMRDTLVYIDGVSDYGWTDHKLNTAFTLGQQEGNLGAEKVRQVLKDNFDLDISYYLMVDFETFAIAIDTLFPEGVEIDAQFSTIDGMEVDSVEVPDDLGFASGGSLYQIIEVGQQTMDGKTLLNYARFRTDDAGDYGRTQRQQQVLTAILEQIKDPTKLFTGSEALGKVYALTSTNLTLPFILEQGLATLVSGNLSIKQVTVPEQGDWLDAYDRYGGLGLSINFDYYQSVLSELGLR